MSSGRLGSDFDYTGPLTELVLLGNMALRLEKKLEWDARELNAPNAREAGQNIRRQYHKGWNP